MRFLASFLSEKLTSPFMLLMIPRTSASAQYHFTGVVTLNGILVLVSGAKTRFNKEKSRNLAAFSILKKVECFSQLMGMEKPSWDRNLWGNATDFKRHLLDKNQVDALSQNPIWRQNRFVSVIIKTIATFWCKVMSTANNEIMPFALVQSSTQSYREIGLDGTFHFIWEWIL